MHCCVCVLLCTFIKHRAPSHSSGERNHTKSMDHLELATTQPHPQLSPSFQCQLYLWEGKGANHCELHPIHFQELRSFSHCSFHSSSSLRNKSHHHSTNRYPEILTLSLLGPKMLGENQLWEKTFTVRENWVYINETGQSRFAKHTLPGQHDTENIKTGKKNTLFIFLAENPGWPQTWSVLPRPPRC